MRRRAALLGIIFALAAGAAADAAEPRPRYIPTRDVSVAYRVQGRTVQNIRAFQVRFAAASRRLRVETDDTGMGSLLVDVRARRAMIVIPGLAQHVEIPLLRDRRASMLFNDRLDFTRRGEQRIAGHACRLWDVRSGRDRARMCLTADGVLLRFEGTGGEVVGTAFEASAVTYAAQPAALFHAPAGGDALRLPDLFTPAPRSQAPRAP